MTTAIAAAPPTSVIRHLPHPAPSATPLRAFLEQTGSLILQGLPRRVWVEASIVAVKVSRFGHTIELVDPAPPPAPNAQLRAFLPTGVLGGLKRQIGGGFDPLMLIGLTIVVEIEPTFDPKWHLQARVHRIAGDASASLYGKLVEKLRETLRAEGLYGRQKALPTPKDITRLAVVHPPGAAGFADVAGELRLWSDAGILHVAEYTAPFEGDAAPAAIAEAIRKAAQLIDGQPPDVIVVVRGGGGRSGLLTLDAEAVVRAACLCSVPIVVGAGHAIDRSLLDEVCWRNFDTPSKALASVADLIVGPARQARTDIGLVQMYAERMVDDAVRTLTHLCGGVEQSASQHLETIEATLREIQARIHGHRSGTGERIHRHAAEAGSILERIVAGALNTLHRGERETSDAVRSITETSRHLVDTSDAGAAFMALVNAKSAATIDRHRRDADELERAVLRSADRHLAAMEAELIRQDTLVTSLAPERVLARGYAVVRASAGTFVTTAAALTTGQHVVLCFADGAVAVTVENPMPRHEAGALS